MERKRCQMLNLVYLCNTCTSFPYYFVDICMSYLFLPSRFCVWNAFISKIGNCHPQEASHPRPCTGIEQNSNILCEKHSCNTFPSEMKLFLYDLPDMGGWNSSFQYGAGGKTPKVRLLTA